MLIFIRIRTPVIPTGVHFFIVLYKIRKKKWFETEGAPKRWKAVSGFMKLGLF